MTYASSGQIDAQDYNDLINMQIGSSVYTLNEIFGLGNGDAGYGGGSTNVSQSPDISEVVFGHDVESQEWKDLRNAFSDIALHQGTALPDGLPSAALLDVGDTVTYFNKLESFANMNAIETNRLTANPSNHTIANKLSDSRATSWMSSLTHEFTVDFGDEDSARHFFNTGGQIRVNASRTGGSSSSHNTAWSTLLSTNSPYIFDSSDFYTLPTSYTILQTRSAGGAYTELTWEIRAQVENVVGMNGGNGDLIRFRSIFIDGYPLPHPQPDPDTGGGPTFRPDMIDGTITSSIDERRSTGIFVRPSPSFNTTTFLSSGS